MSDVHEGAAGAARPGTDPMTGHRPVAAPAHRWAGRSALVVPALLVGLGVFLVYGVVDMEVTDDSELFGPTVFPTMVAVTCFVVAVLLAVSIVRDPEVPEPHLDADGEPVGGTVSNWRATGITVGSFVLFGLLLQPVGWIIAAALVFWGVTVGLGSTRYVFNLMVGLALSSVMQLVFAGLLGLNLPPGVFGVL
ncbi:tripartite tricarboxylate transporter TctB family protein [Jannaschia sp. R86511]|uniref:tripartite tricarboxylate transporter TctB family protein n=1 Tax=Jannaschia sp. R86511 TaxID=3093853 RepID=UPI0036D2B838